MKLRHPARAALITVTLAACQGSPSSPPAPATAASASASAVPSASASAAPPTPSAVASAPAPTGTALASEYRGTIGSGLAVVARLHHDGARVFGTYFYEKSGADLTLTGTLTAGHLLLDELVDKTKTGSIEADVASDGSLSGTWKNPKGDKTLPFHVTPIVPDASPKSAIVFKKTQKKSVPVPGKKSKDDVCTISLEYAEVFGLPPAATAKINAKLAPAEEVKMPSPCDHAVSTTAAYKIARNDHGVLSVRLTGYLVDSQAPHGVGGNSAVSVFVDTGAEIKLLGDVLKPNDGATLRAALGPLVDSAAKQEGWEPGDKPRVMDALTSSSSFLLETDGLRIFQDSLPANMAGAGVDGFLIPFAKLPRPSGRLGALWDK